MLLSKRRLPERVRPVVEPLEPRILYSADLGPAALVGGAYTGAAEHRMLDQAAETHAGKLVFVDASTPDYQTLIDGIRREAGAGRDIEVIVLDSERDGVEQISEALAGRRGVSAVHIVAHGSDGALQLGAGTLDARSLLTHEASVAGWRDALSADADLVLYGCDLAAGAEGRALVDALAGLTGADVAASADKTGHAALGGDWDLEYTSGVIEARLAFSAQARENWYGLLPVANLTASQDTYIVSSTNDNYGGSTQLVLDHGGGSLGNQRLLVQFDLSGIPAGALINSASLQMEATAVSGAITNLQVHALQAAWTEGAANGTAGVANWNQRVAGTNWGTAGGDFDAAAAANVSVGATPGTHSWNLTALVQDWVNGTRVNNGVLIGSPDGGSETVTYDSRETASGTAPRLVIDYVGNIAPTLDAGASPALAPVNEDAGAPVGPVGTLVSSLVDFAVPAGQLDNVTDPDAGALLGIAITGADSANGTWWHSTDGGTNWNPLGAVSDTAARLLAADANSRVYFQPNADFNGVIGAALTFRAWDQTSGVAGGLADTLNVPFSVRDNFTAVSYANNDGTAQWSGGWVDTDGNPSAGNIQVSGGELVFSSLLIATDSIYREVNLGTATGATLSFSYNNALGALGSTVTLQASANGGGSYTTLTTFSSANSGVNTHTVDLTPYLAPNTRIRFVMGSVLLGGSFRVDNLEIAYTVPPGGTTAFSAATDTASLTVVSVNDAPSGASNTMTVLEDGAHLFSAADFGFSDVDGNALAAVRVATPPAAGTLTNNGVAVTVGQFVSAADIAGGLLVFTPVPDASGASYASFTFQVQDDGGTANGGVDLDPIARTMTIDVTAVNDAPSGASNTVATPEDTDYVFGAADFGFSDTDGNALAAVRVATLPAAGTLTNNGVAVTVGQFVSAADIGAGLLRFTPGANASGLGYASFTFQVQDDGGTANGGVDLDPIARTMTIDVTAVNDAPSGTDNTVTVLEDGAHVFSAADFGFSDVDGNALAAVRITTLPGAGTLTNNGVALTAGQFASAADIAGGLLVFTPAPDANGIGYASFTFQVQDDGGGTDLDPTPRTLTIDVTAVNDPPAGAPTITGTVAEDQVLTADTSTLSDAEGLGAFSYQWLRDGTPIGGANGVSYTLGDADVGALMSVQVSYTDGAGTAESVTSAQTAPVANVNDAPAGAPSVTGTPTEDQLLTADTSGMSDADGLGAYSYQWLRGGAPIAGATSSTYTPGDADVGAMLSVVASYVDGQGTVESVTSAGVGPIANVNDAPAGTSGAVGFSQDTAYVFGTADFGFTDPADSPTNSLLAVRIATLPANGALTLGGAPVAAGQFVSTADIAAGLLVFTPPAGVSGAGYASFTFQVQDDGGGSDLDATARVLTLNVNAASAPSEPPPAPVPEPTPAPEPLPEPPVPPPAAETTASTPALSVPRTGGGAFLLFETEEGEANVLAPIISRDPMRAAALGVGLRVTVPAGAPGEAAAEALLELRGAGVQRTTQVVQLEELLGAGGRPGPLAEDIDELRESVQQQTLLQQGTIGALAFGSLSLTVGYVLWIVRGGVLAASLLSTLPAWRFLDPLPVLGRIDDEDEEEAGADDDPEIDDDVAFQAFLEERAR